MPLRTDIACKRSRKMMISETLLKTEDDIWTQRGKLGNDSFSHEHNEEIDCLPQVHKSA